LDADPPAQGVNFARRITGGHRLAGNPPLFLLVAKHYAVAKRKVVLNNDAGLHLLPV